MPGSYYTVMINFRFTATYKLKSLTFFVSQSVDRKKLDHFCRLLNANLFSLSEDVIQSGWYVLHTLEATIWRLVTTDCYEIWVVLYKAVNLGYYADTTGEVTGGLAGLLYGYESITGN